jgi:hypothetical protein
LRVEALAGQPGRRQLDLLGGFGLDTEMVERPSGAMAPRFGVFDQGLQGCLGDGEVGVAQPDLGRLGGEQLE